MLEVMLKNKSTIYCSHILQNGDNIKEFLLFEDNNLIASVYYNTIEEIKILDKNNGIV